MKCSIFLVLVRFNPTWLHIVSKLMVLWAHIHSFLLLFRHRRCRFLHITIFKSFSHLLQTLPKGNNLWITFKICYYFFCCCCCCFCRYCVQCVSVFVRLEIIILYFFCVYVWRSKQYETKIHEWIARARFIRSFFAFHKQYLLLCIVYLFPFQCACLCVQVHKYFV